MHTQKQKWIESSLKKKGAQTQRTGVQLQFEQKVKSFKWEIKGKFCRMTGGVIIEKPKHP